MIKKFLIHNNKSQTNMKKHHHKAHKQIAINPKSPHDIRMNIKFEMHHTRSNRCAHL